MTAVVRGIVIFLVRLLVGAYANWQGCAPLPRLRIYFANHSSHLDTVAIVAALPPELRATTHPVAALDYWGGSKFRKFIAVQCLSAVLIDRSGAAGADTLEPLAALLDAGESLIIFPEGTRGQGDIGQFRSGLFNLARRFPDAELVPVYLENLHRVLPKSTMLIVPLICTSWFGTPLRLLPDEDRAAFLERARAAVVALADGRRAPAAQVA